MTVFTISFFGHRQLSDSLAVEKKLHKIIQELLTTREYVEFLVGRNGEFDQVVASTVRRCKREIRDDNSSLVLVLPYETAEYRNNQQSFLEYYDEIEICELSGNRHYKAAYQVRNGWMVEKSDLVVFCVEHQTGGAYTTMQLAKKKLVPLVNLFDL